MTNAIVPLNIAALRVNNNDVTNVVSALQGKTAAFESMPWYDPLKKAPQQASTGDKIYAPLMVVNNAPLASPANPLGVGVHLHWELPDYFRKGRQEAQDATVRFPAAPNRWLVTRFLSFYDPQAKRYGSVSTKSWVVESDYLSPQLLTGKDGVTRPMISVPLPSTPAFQKRPYMYMGRVLDAEDWNPDRESPADFLPAYQGTDGKQLYLTAIGFVGAYFGSYYPECCSVYGFWDHFADVPYPGYASLRAALQANVAVQFRTSYQVTGWLNEATADPLADIDQLIGAQYQAYLRECDDNQVEPALTPTDFFRQIAADQLRWRFNLEDVGYRLKEHHAIAELNYPTRTLSSGTTQELVWNALSGAGVRSFLRSNDPAYPALWNAKVELAIGNSIEEAVGALLKSDMGQRDAPPDVLTNYELLLDALQLGLLADMEDQPNKLIGLEEALHANAFSSHPGGHLWLVGSEEISGDGPVDPDQEITLPLALAEQLYLLNRAQKDYDMGRAALLTMRKQLFMDWTHYVKMYTGEIGDPNIQQADMTRFIGDANGGQLKAVKDKGRQVGILSYPTDPVSGVVSMRAPPDGVAADSLAQKLWQQYQQVSKALDQHQGWTLQCAKPEAFYQPNEPLVLMQGEMMQPVARNSKAKQTFVRLGTELLSQLRISYNSSTLTLPAGAIPGRPLVNAAVPLRAEVQALLDEAWLITPMLAGSVAAALAALGGADNPARDSQADFTTSLMYAEGGLNALEILPNPGGVAPPAAGGLYAAVRTPDYVPAANSAIEVGAPQQLSIVFSNDQHNGWAPNAIGWTTQTTPTGFPEQQVNPFLPVFMIWNVRLDPLRRLALDPLQNQVYGADNLRDLFELDTDAVDYVYKMDGHIPADFTAPLPVRYGNSTTMNPNSTGVLAYQIRSHIAAHPDDPENPVLETIAKLYSSKKFLAQSIGGFNLKQVLNEPIAQVAVEDLTRGGRDNVTTAVANAARENSWDNWYRSGFNGVAPINTTTLAQNNFGPLRAGFLDLLSIEIVDVFGQRMKLGTAAPGPGPDETLRVVTAASMTPPDDDLANQGRVYLPPRVLAPTRLWFQWLSAAFDHAVPGVSGDVESLGQHPATSPVCGWTLPNHLDNNLFFYDAAGLAIGTFGVEHLATSPVLKYRTRAGNMNNPGNDLARDIGPRGQPKVNPNLAHYLWHLHDQDAAYLADLMKVIQNSTRFMNPANYAQNASLAVFIGKPLALVRTVVGLETAGNLLPLSVADTVPGNPLPQDVLHQRVEYTERMPFSSARLQQVDFPLRMGDLANLDDGLIGYLQETSGPNPYQDQVFFSPAADAAMRQGVRRPDSDTLRLRLNDKPQTLTMLVDPRAPVHATTGILPVNELSIPPDQYGKAMANLAVNFISRPLLKMAQGLVVPLPAERGYRWSWITPGESAATPLTANAANATPAHGYSPQTLQEGWLELTPEDKP